ncbi:MAG: hypothetical protein Kow0069_03590 [Promethearchaeota archaeon]
MTSFKGRESPRLLLVQAYDPESLLGHLLGDLRGYREHLLEKFPEQEVWLPKEPFDREPPWPEGRRVKAGPSATARNVAGHFLAANLAVPTRVVDEPVTPQVLARELESGGYTHVGFSVYVNGYSDFLRCARFLKREYPHLVVLAGNAGALFPETDHHVDAVCLGHGVPFLRRLFGQPEDDPYRLEMIDTSSTLRLAGGRVRLPRATIVTKVGCPVGCDFCVTHRLYGGKWFGPFFTPAEVHEALVRHREEVGRDFQTWVAEPLGLANGAWWRELFSLFEGEAGDYPVWVSATASILERFDLDAARNSAMRLEVVNVGVESLSRGYSKNRGVDVGRLVGRLADHGVGSWLTYIVGFDHHDREGALAEVEVLAGFDALVTDVANLMALPGTEVWRRLEREGRLLAGIPRDFFFTAGFQAFRHPHFRPGFVDVVPLLVEAAEVVERERGVAGLNFLPLIRNLSNPSPAARAMAQLLEWHAKKAFPRWVEAFSPTPAQIAKYGRKLGGEGKVGVEFKSA